jgi:hypothetical protein
MLNAAVVDPDVEALVLKLIDRYKPISRWPEAVIRQRQAAGAIYACAVAQIFVTHRSNAPIIRNP